MTASVISRGPISTFLLNQLKLDGFPVGDNTSPEEPFGWSGEPNAANKSFTPWRILSPGPANPENPPGAIGDTGQAWRLFYNVFHAGVSRKQCEALADKTRDSFTSVARIKITTPSGEWQIMNIKCTNLGSVSRVASVYPDHFTQSDSYEVRITKG